MYQQSCHAFFTKEAYHLRTAAASAEFIWNCLHRSYHAVFQGHNGKNRTSAKMLTRFGIETIVLLGWNNDFSAAHRISGK
jgi:hypothetical protein